ncbi:hypothetical protein ACFFOM_01670 [Microlunatus capsulatus]|uniref:DUF4352 domain-containing protein n=1 Tax=Microlunatus capsulatus TaxID=99117 RepID=A0ABS4Z3E4_9ACTN|nr:hypothetical protein [Microlunatus capsulatus]MBP2415571.1 hypothetical protein [Microlunatus capsulatus]
MRGITQTWTAVRLWLVPAAVLVLAVVVLAVSGGLDKVTGAQGRAAEPGEELALSRWVLVVRDAALVDGNDYDPASEPPRVRLHLRATFDGEETAYGLPTSMVTVQLPPGLPPLDATPLTDGDRDGNLDPGVGQELTLELAWPDAPARAPGTVRVLVRDEEERDNYLTGDAWEVRPSPSRHVDLALPDQRTVR